MWIQYYIAVDGDTQTYGFPVDEEDEIIAADRAALYSEEEHSVVTWEEVPCQFGTREQLEVRIRQFHHVARDIPYENVRRFLLQVIDSVHSGDRDRDDIGRQLDLVYPLGQCISYKNDCSYAETLREAVGDCVRFHFKEQL